LSHKHQNLLKAVFQNPLNHNIHWREILSMLKHYGAVVEPTHGAGFRVVLNDAECFLHHPNHQNVCDETTIKLLREFLARTGLAPER